MSDVNLNNQDYNYLAVCSFRYALGRNTYMPSIICEILINNIDKLDEHTKQLMVKEIDEAGPQQYADLDMEWQSLRLFLVNSML